MCGKRVKRYIANDTKIGMGSFDRPHCAANKIITIASKAALFIFQSCIDIFVNRYKALEVDAIAGLDARGFVLGPPIALALKKPFIMIRKKGKLPNAVTGANYFKEYEGGNAQGGDELCISRNALKPGQRILVIDDLVATGGTLTAACDLIAAVGGVIVECACIVELKMLQG